MFNQIPPSIYIAIGALTAALIAGLFSYLNMIAAKENKVSEFRQEWITELRNEIATLTSASQSLSHDVPMYNEYDFEEEKNKIDFLGTLNERRERAISALTKITLMLNYKHLQQEGSLEHKLMSAIEDTRVNISEKNLDEIINISNEVRKSAGPLLKDNWEIVKKGESGYNKIRKRVRNTLTILFATIAIFIILLIYHSQTTQPEEQKKELIFKYKSNPTQTEISIN